MTEEQIQFMVEDIAKDLILLLIEEHRMKLEEAVDKVYTSQTFSKVTDLRTNLYTQSTTYIYECLNRELEGKALV